MQGLLFFGHEGHPHEETIEPWWTDELTVSIVAILGLIGLLLAATAFKAKMSIKLTLALFYLLVLGIATYQVAPILSIVALAIGMTLALVTTLLQLAHKK